MRVWCSGNTAAFQAVFTSSNLVTRSFIERTMTNKVQLGLLCLILAGCSRPITATVLGERTEAVKITGVRARKHSLDLTLLNEQTCEVRRSSVSKHFSNSYKVKPGLVVQIVLERTRYQSGTEEWVIDSLRLRQELHKLVNQP